MDALEDAERQTQIEMRRLATLVQTLIDQNAAGGEKGGRGEEDNALPVANGELAGLQEPVRGASGRGVGSEDDLESEYGATATGSPLSMTPDL